MTQTEIVLTDALTALLWEHTVKQADGCWTRNKTLVGYKPHQYSDVAMNVDGKRIRYRAHRYAYTLLVGPIPKHLPDLDHLCHVKICVNPDHLEPVTHAENVRRGSLRVTHCKRGHEYTEENTYVYAGTAHRICKTCQKLNQRARKLGVSLDAYLENQHLIGSSDISHLPKPTPNHRIDWSKVVYCEGACGRQLTKVEGPTKHAGKGYCPMCYRKYHRKTYLNKP